jgi:hypothetical protein
MSCAQYHSVNKPASNHHSQVPHVHDLPCAVGLLAGPKAAGQQQRTVVMRRVCAAGRNRPVVSLVLAICLSAAAAAARVDVDNIMPGSATVNMAAEVRTG